MPGAGLGGHTVTQTKSTGTEHMHSEDVFEDEGCGGSGECSNKRKLCASPEPCFPQQLLLLAVQLHVQLLQRCHLISRWRHSALAVLWRRLLLADAE